MDGVLIGHEGEEAHALAATDADERIHLVDLEQRTVLPRLHLVLVGRVVRHRRGRHRWRYEAPAAESGAFGFPGSPALGEGLVFVSGLDGGLYAFAQ